MDATIDRAFHKLEANLEELTKIYRSLLDIVRKEKENLLKADLLSFSSISAASSSAMYAFLKSINGGS